VSVTIWVILVLLPVAFGLYGYVGYPALLWLGARWRDAGNGDGAMVGDEWPSVSIVLPAYNEEATLEATIANLLELDYPRDRLQVLVVSDASSDRTDEIAMSFADRGVELYRLPERGGKTAAENASRFLVRGEIVVNTDASVQVDPHALKPLVAAFRDPTVGVASGRDVSVGTQHDRNVGETGYVNYEMLIRDLETAVGGIVGASGCFFASRRDLHGKMVPQALSRDFAAPLVAREHGYRTVSVPNAVCYVPRTPSLGREYRRKVRTMARGLDTLYFKRALLNPFRYGIFAFKLASHKLARWLVPPAALVAVPALVVLAIQQPWARWIAAISAAGLVLGVLGLVWRGPSSPPRMFAIPAYILSSIAAGVQAWGKAIRRERSPIWEPTRR
jgi:cellulose synthase/poly-beta-1,6-N-acetylglucosamine synthase-like glycosyltransferase